MTLLLSKVYSEAKNSKGFKVEKGMKATQIMWSDRNPYTVVGVSESGGTILLQEDKYDASNFEWTNGRAKPVRDEDGRVVKALLSRKSKNGNVYVYKGNRYVVGTWEYFRDPHF